MQRAMIIVLMSLWLAACGNADKLIGMLMPSPTPAMSQAELTMTICGLPDEFAQVADAGHTLILDGEGEDSDGMRIEDLACALKYMDVPSYVVSMMEKTRALDGIQREEYDNFKISWSYHPDNGLDVVINEK
jgi:hypothetical protein